MSAAHSKVLPMSGAAVVVGSAQVATVPTDPDVFAGDYEKRRSDQFVFPGRRSRKPMSSVTMLNGLKSREFCFLRC